MKTMRYLLVLGLMALMTMVLAACGDDPTPTPRPAAEPTATQAPAPDDTMMDGEKPTLIFADLNWSSAVLQNHVARLVLEHGYGYETDAVAGGTVPLMQALVGGEVNVNMEIWLPNQQEAWDKAVADGTIEGIGDSLSSVAWQSAFLIPQYTADANPGLRSVDDLKNPEYQALFARSGTGGKAGLITCIPGWECEIRNEQQVVGYGLADHVELINPGSFEGLNAEILGGFETGEDLLFYYWGPTALIGRLVSDYGGYLRLEEPASTPECEEHIRATHDTPDKTEFACEYADAQVVIAMRTDLAEKAPDVVEFFEGYTLSDDGIFSLLGRYADTGEDAVDVASYWLRTSHEWQSWVAPDVADKVLAALGGPLMMEDAMMEEKPTLVFADLNWSSAVLQNHVARLILENGYGYETDAVAGGTLPLMQALVGGDLNVNMEIWLPNQQEAWDKAVADGTIEGIGDSLTSVAWQSAFLIPQYTADANPGLRSVEDLKDPEHQALFARSGTGGKAGLITCIPGWECEIRNEQQVVGYGLADHVELINPGSFEGLNAEILGGFETRDDLLFYYWGPTALIGKLVSDYGGYLRLEEPASTPECEKHIGATHDNPADTELACEYADARVVIAMRTDLAEKAPDVVEFFEAYELSDDGIFSLLSRYADTGEDAVDVAAWWLQNSDEWQSWVGPGVADKVLAGL